METKGFKITIKLELEHFISAKTKKQAIKICKKDFNEQYDIELEDSELEIEELEEN